MGGMTHDAADEMPLPIHSFLFCLCSKYSPKGHWQITVQARH